LCATGAKIWSFATKDFGPSAPKVANGVVYFGSFSGRLYALKASTGTRLWTFATGDGAASPAEANEVIYFSSGDTVYALNAATGAKMWTFASGVASSAVANGVVYIGSGDGHMYAFHLPGRLTAINRPTPGQLHTRTTRCGRRITPEPDPQWALL
jgi:eukaryotic-like serine/threonine-protein kinase